VCETGDLRFVWAHKNAQKWNVPYTEFLKLCVEDCACCGSHLDYGLGENNQNKGDDHTPSTDHMIPRSVNEALTEDIKNLWIICLRCNKLKNDSTPQDIHRMKRIIETLEKIK
jgi:5-methylcytosine-specific restriction endonuclease McrA